MKKIDCHVHFVGGGTAESGSWFQLKTFWDRLQARMMLRGCGIEPSAMLENLDLIYTRQLCQRNRNFMSLMMWYLNWAESMRKLFRLFPFTLAGLMQWMSWNDV